MNKKILVNKTAYNFTYLKDLNLWIIKGDRNLFPGHHIDLEIDLNSIEESVDWGEITGFISYLQRRNNKTNNDIFEKSFIALKGLFNSVYKDSLSEDVKSNVEFELTGIDFKRTIKSRLGSQYEYDLYFFPYSKKHNFMDIGSFAWRIKMKGNILYGVTCDI